jgi:hypothetical protein|tara:strand:- start:450 stop:695 length:246 start_codon:yes stop_codon:yes gene_type:complete
MNSRMIMAIIKPLLPKFVNWLSNRELADGEISSSVILSADRQKKQVRIDICAMKIVTDENENQCLAISRVLETFGEEEILG